MSYAAKTVFAFALYMAGQGAILMVAPNFLLGMFGIPEATEVWVRVVGLALIVFAYYYTRCAFSENTDFFKFSVHGRTIQFFLFVGLVVTKQALPIVLMFASVELASGIWTYFALKSDGK
jgi:hypothetical protein